MQSRRQRAPACTVVGQEKILQDLTSNGLTAARVRAPAPHANARLMIAEVKRRLADTFGVDQERVKITIEA